MSDDITVTEIDAAIYHIPKSRRHRVRLHATHINVIERPSATRIIVPLNDPKGYIQINLSLDQIVQLNAITNKIIKAAQ